MLKKIAITLSLLLSLAACSSSEKEPSAKADMANPAAEFCAERGIFITIPNDDERAKLKREQSQ